MRQCGAFREGDTLAAQYYLDDEDIARKFGHLVPSTLADLIDIAVAVHMADRLAPRRCRNSELAWWRRDLHVTVPVRRLGLWSSVEIQNALLETLRFLTDDDWSIKFSSRLESGRVSETQYFLFPEPFEGPPNVGLYSGGLDSLAGTAAALGSDSVSDFVCVSGVPNHRQGLQQRLQVEGLNRLNSGRVTHVRVPCWLQSANELAQDASRRTRGFLFLLLGRCHGTLRTSASPVRLREWLRSHQSSIPTRPDRYPEFPRRPPEDFASSEQFHFTGHWENASRY